MVVDMINDRGSTSLASLEVVLPPSPIDSVLAKMPPSEVPPSGSALLTPAYGKVPTKQSEALTAAAQMERLGEEKARSDITSEMRETIEEMEKSLKNKLYHQFMVGVEAYCGMCAALPSTTKYSIVHFITHTVRPIIHNVNQLTFINLLAEITSPIEGIEALKMIETYMECIDVSNDTVDVFVMFNCLKALHLALSGYIKPCEALLERIKEYLDSTFGVAVTISSAFHKASLSLHKATKDYSNLYRHALMYLAYTPLNSIPPPQRVLIAADLCTAAAVAHDVYNIGELVQHSILTDSLRGHTDLRWLMDILDGLNEGCLVKFDEAIERHKAKVVECEAIRESLADGSLRRKVTLLTLTEMSFQRGKKKRMFSFDEIAAACRINRDEVELLVMTAMSANLIRGHIDEVEGVVTVVWVRPRILDTQRIEVMKNRMSSWALSASQLLTQIEALTPELIGKE